MTATQLDDIYDKISDYIISGQGQCVLLLGPELSVDQAGRDYKSYFKELAALEKENIDRYFDSENLFAFRPNASERDVRSIVRKFYSNVGDPVLSEMIARIKLPLIINVSPDIAINKVYTAKQIQYKSGYFSKESKQKFNALPYPTKDLPVIYNIFGSVENEQSLIQTHGKLYETVEHLLPENSLPDNIELFLKEDANSFIFLGFKFDSWHYQLICHKLKINYNKNRTNLSAPDYKTSDAVNIIMGNNFVVDFTSENPEQMVQRIINECEKKDPSSLRLKEPHSNFSVFISYARDAGDLEPGAASRETIVDELEETLKEKGGSAIQVFRDRKDLTYGESIDSFMTRIGKGKTVIRVISDKYLKSRYCMDEALRISRYNDTEKRIFTIVLADVNLDDAQTGIYRDYWRNKCGEVFEDIENKLDGENYDIYVAIFRFINRFIAGIKDEVHLPAAHSDADFELFVNTIIQKIKQD
jgi:hypothetical protein